MKLVQCDFCKEVCRDGDVCEYYNVRTDPGAKILLEFKPDGDMCLNCAEAVCQAVREALNIRAKEVCKQ